MEEGNPFTLKRFAPLSFPFQIVRLFQLGFGTGMDDSYEELPWSPHPETVAWLESLPFPPGRSAPALPTSRQDWELVERYRLLVTSINHVAQWENARLQQEKQQWEQRSELLSVVLIQRAKGSQR